MKSARKTKRQIMEGIENTKARIIDHNTVEYFTANGDKIIRLHLTDIITIKPTGEIVLNSGNWRTPTTKDRISKYSGLRIWQERGQWFVGGRLFYDGITFKNGKLISKDIKPDDKKINKIKAQIKSYCDLITKDNLPIPNSGDCWYCCMHDVKEDHKTLGDLTGNHDHLKEHLKEKYLHGSILVNAMREAGYSDQQIGVHYAIKVVDTFKRSVRKYLQKRLIMGLAVR
jgi:hypothetical protein